VGFLASPPEIVERVLQCDCGFEARADDEDGLVDEIRRHARDVHGMALSEDEALHLVAVNAPPRDRKHKEER
jgi:predicted small metal-binding protein